jgi:signal transduction histidine kinase
LVPQVPLFRWPRSLFGRLALILFAGLALAHALSLTLILTERAEQDLMLTRTFIARDIAGSIAILEHVPPEQRSGWLDKLDRQTYWYLLDPPPRGAPTPQRPAVAELVAALTSNVALIEPISVTRPVSRTKGALAGLVHMRMRLSDGSPLTVALVPPTRVISLGLPVAVSLALIAAFTWVAVRLATRPLVEFAQAADKLGTDLRAAPLPEDGPTEVARASAAFNAMQKSIAEHLAERMRILAAVSHDLQTPITRMRLRVDSSDDPALRDKLHGDLQLMQGLVEEGIEYARSANAVNELPCRTDLHTLLDSLVYDYLDAGRQIRLVGKRDEPLTTRPRTLRRVVTNLLDNALKFGTDVDIVVETQSPNRVDIVVRDRGPGIPENELRAALRPFYRVEGSRNRETGGTGLGLAIANQLTLALGGTLTLSNRDGGGLEARLSLPAG